MFRGIGRGKGYWQSFEGLGEQNQILCCFEHLSPSNSLDYVLKILITNNEDTVTYIIVSLSISLHNPLYISCYEAYFAHRRYGRQLRQSVLQKVSTNINNRHQVVWKLSNIIKKTSTTPSCSGPISAQKSWGNSVLGVVFSHTMPKMDFHYSHRFS